MNTPRIPWADTARIIAIIAVISIHSIDTTFYFNKNHTTSDINFQNITHIIGRTGVPLFLMLTGALVVEKCSKTGISEFYLGKIPALIISTIVSFIFTNWTIAAAYQQPFSLLQSFSDLYSGEMKNAYQLWYMWMIIEAYIALPFLSRLLTSISIKQSMLYVAFCLFFVFRPAIERGAGLEKFAPGMGSEFFGCYIAYIATGHLISNITLPANNHKFTLFCGMASAITIGATIMMSSMFDPQRTNIDIFSWYDSPFIFILSTLIFVIIKSNSQTPIKSTLTKSVSKLSFGIYLIHLVPLSLSTHFLSELNMPLILKSLLTTAVTGVSSYILAKIASKTPVLKFVIRA